MFVAVAKITLSIPGAGSLKSKRQVLHKVIDKVKARFNASIAEVADNDLWQRATLGLATVANEHNFARESLDKVLRFIEELYVAEVVDQTTEVITLGGEDDGSHFGSEAGGTQRTLADAEREARGESNEPEPHWRRPVRSSEERDGGRFGRKTSRPPMNEAERTRAIDEFRERYRAERQRKAHDDGERNR